ncbi:MAG: FG-GAP-like repeat-containing protein [Marinoscillum sp.]
MRYYLSLSLLLMGLLVMAQKPIINSLDKYSTQVGESLFINGSNFPTSAANVRVNLGAGVATVVSSSVNQIEVTVPNTATYGPVVVTNLTNGLSGVSVRPFLLSFSGNDLDGTAFTNRITSDSDLGTYDLCTCDFDGDGKTDVGVANLTSTNISIFRNLTSFGNSPSFSKIIKANGYETVSTECADLNGDGLPELVAVGEEASVAQHVFIYLNTSTSGSINLTKTIEFRLPDQSVTTPRRGRKMKIADVDLDGRKDLIVGTTTDNRIYIFRNTSSAGTLQFNTTPTELIVSGVSNGGALDVGDLNSDGLPDIAVLPFDDPGSNIAIFKNQSSSGSPSFSQQQNITSSGHRINILIADLNGDSKPDIITTSRTANRVDVFQNTSTGSNITFNNSPTIKTGISGAWGLSAGDMNGDGLTDIGVAALSANFYILENNSSAGSLVLDTRQFALGPDNRNVRFADIDGDSKPDVLTANNSGSSVTGNLSTVLNKNCIVPVISPTDLTFCLNNPITLHATKTVNASYTWSVTSGTGTVVNNGDNADINVTATSNNTATIQVTITANDASGCAVSSSETFSLTGGTAPPKPSITNATSTKCSGENITLTTDQGSADEYYWINPNGELITTTTNELVLSDLSSSEAGAYSVRTFTNGSCTSISSDDFNLVVDEPPLVIIANTGDDRICAGASVTLQVPDYDGFTYQWKLDGNNVESDQNTLSASASGNYTVELTSAALCSNESEPLSLTVVNPPTGVIDSDNEICVGVGLDFDASNSQGSPLTYSWDFDDGNNGTGVNTSHTFSTPDTYTVTLTTGLSDVDACESTTTKDILVSAPPSSDDIIDLMSPDPRVTFKCPEDALTLTLPSSITSATWTIDGTNTSGNSIDVATGDNQTSVNVSLDVTTDIGCTVTGTTVTVSNFENSGFTFSSPDGTIVNDTIELETVSSSVRLEVSAGSDFTWSPESILDTNTGNSVTVYPSNRVSEITVTGTDEAGCSITSDITVITPGVIARKSFSPNGDNIYDCWEIINANALDACSIYIFDQKGSYVFKGASPFTDNCVWNGNIDNGSVQVPTGVYYYVLKCGNNSFSQTGTILLAR